MMVFMNQQNVDAIFYTLIIFISNWKLDVNMAWFPVSHESPPYKDLFIGSPKFTKYKITSAGSNYKYTECVT